MVLCGETPNSRVYLGERVNDISAIGFDQCSSRKFPHCPIKCKTEMIGSMRHPSPSPPTRDSGGDSRSGRRCQGLLLIRKAHSTSAKAGRNRL